MLRYCQVVGEEKAELASDETNWRMLDENAGYRDGKYETAPKFAAAVVGKSSNIGYVKISGGHKETVAHQYRSRRNGDRHVR